jgi:hypothetical protein
MYFNINKVLARIQYDIQPHLQYNSIVYGTRAFYAAFAMALE